MAKSNRHKKLRKQEKAKTQLTGVRKLNKPQNVVEPTLRVKKILIREQLKTGSLLPDQGQGQQSALRLKQSQSSQSSVITEEEESYTRRRQSVQDLLSTANHHNVNMRKDALVGLQEIAMSHFNTILRNLDRILTKIASIASDKEGVVRKENLKLAECVLSKISENQLRPFWSMLIAHLKCALTHLIPSVRYGALSFVELLVDHHSTLIAESSSVILPSILALITTTSKDPKEKLTSSSQKNSTNTNVTKLKVEMTGKHGDMVERLKVLRMLSKCLQVSSMNAQDVDQSIANRKQKNGIGPGNSIKPTNYLGMRYPFGYCWDQDEEKEMGEKYSLQGLSSSSSYSSRFYSTMTADPFASPFAADSNHRASEFWIEFLGSCIPVLIETWVELGPSSTQPSASYGNSDKKSTKGRMKQRGPSELGSDKDSTAGRRNGLHILNETNVDNLLCITTLFEQLLHMNGINVKSGVGGSSNIGSEEQSVKTIRKTQGQNLAKYFFHLMPYISLQDSRRKDVISVNLKLFKIAGELKNFDKEMKKKLQIFIVGAMERRTLDREHCKQILGIMSFMDSTQVKDLCTQFLMFATKLGQFDLIASFLCSLINLAIPFTQHNKGVQELVSGLQWNEIISGLIQNWSVTEANGQIHTLLELLTFVALRRLANMKHILQENAGKLKELIGAVASNNTSLVWESVYRTFVYSDATSRFQTEFADMYPSDFILA